MRNKKDSKNQIFYTDFGASVHENDYSIMYTAARSFLNKTAHLCLASELETLSSYAETEKKLKEFCAKNNEFDVFLNKKLFEVLHNFFYNPSHMVIEIIGETHLAFFYPLPYF